MDVMYDEKHRDSIIMDESSGSSAENARNPAHRVSRSLTEKRKNYVRRMTQTITTKEINAASFGSLHKLPSAASIISQFQKIIDSNRENSPQRTFRRDEANLFKMVLLVGYDITNKKGYVKSLFPKTETALPMIEQFIYPTSKNPCDLMTRENQNFTLILTDEYGNHLFGYCRQIIPEGFENCLPLTYCIISSVNATGFYFNVLKEIEGRHGLPEAQFSYMLRNLQRQEVPSSGKILYVKLLEASPKKLPDIPKKPDRETIHKSQQRLNKRLSLESPEWLKAEASKSSMDHSPINRSLTEYTKKLDEITIRRPNDIRLENSELNVLYESTTSELLVMIFGTLLIERKVILLGKNISQISSCMTALYSILYPFQWHHTIISIVPEQLVELLQAPFPFFAGVIQSTLSGQLRDVEDGIVVDLDNKCLLKKCGDEATLIPETLKKSLMYSLKIVEAMEKGKKLINVLIAEAFIQFFVKLFANLNCNTFEKNKFIETQSDQATKYFLEWFCETVMFKDFMVRRKEYEKQRESGQTGASYFDLFNAKILEKSATLTNQQQRKNVEMLMKSTKHKKRFKDRIKDFLNH